MLDNDFACKTLCEAVKGSLEEDSREDVYLRHERMFVSLASQQKVHYLKRKAVVVGALAAGVAAAAALLVSVLISAPPNDFTFFVGDSRAEGKPGDWIESPSGETTEIQFTQGTRMRVGSNGAARVVESNKEAVTIELTRGTVLAEVTGNHHTRWRVNAGPFTVTVLGTVFEVDWDSNLSQLYVQVIRGKVLVQGAGLSEHGVRLLAGQYLDANGRSGEIAMNTPLDTRDGGVDGAETMLSESGEPTQVEKSSSQRITSAKATTVSTRHSSTRGKTPDAWLVHYQNKRFKDAIDAAEQQGLARIYRSAGETALWQLADAARNAGKITISNDALLSLRKRFGRSKKARLAAFIIGRSAMDASHAPNIAVQWFQTYLGESPQGAMAEEVHGRLMTIYVQGNRIAAAKRIASQYMSRYPQGLYLKQARQVLQK